MRRLNGAIELCPSIDKANAANAEVFVPKGVVKMSDYEVVYPLGRSTQQAKPIAKRLETLDGMTIGQLSNHKFGSLLTFRVLEQALGKRYPAIKFVSHEVFGDTYGSSESEVVDNLPAKLKEYGCDAVISGNGG
jgi:hypothetical protein